MSSTLSTLNRFRHNLPMLAVVGSLVALVFYLLESNFSALDRANDALRHRLASETKQRGENLEVFFADRRSDLKPWRSRRRCTGIWIAWPKG